MPADTSKFHHNKTGFVLEGQHAVVDCRSCHESLVFAEAQTTCISCHVDLHQMTVGSDCARCHNAENWPVHNITELHQENGFPLLGAHASVSCFDCHTSETALRFDRIGNDCINCHLDEFQATTNPDHESAGFSTNCIECHDVSSFDWETETVDHSFFPLTKGHEVNECAKCHVGGDFANTPSDCFACHQMDFEATVNPDHQAAHFITDCSACHTTDIGWMPAEYTAHDVEFFPIYSGAHKDTWDDCASCHTNASDYAVFSCTICHLNPETDEAHVGLSGYTYENSACLACHPAGTSDGSLDHDATNFPLTGAHIGVDCISCHANGYTGTPTDCIACHTIDFQETTNPDHESLSLSTDCKSCHSTEPDWMPATFANHDDFYVLNGAHAAIANDCAACHNGDYNNTPITCAGCHQTDFDNTTNPNHNDFQFSTDCASCHSEDSWIPAPFYHDDHDGQYFPIYSGKHEGEWSQCVECHINPSNYAEFTCVTCHANPETDDQHNGVNGYVYESTACLACHPTGDATNVFDHNNTNFPLTGEHIGVDCISCHAGGYAGTPTDCVACHQTDYEGSVNPNHVSLSIPTDCAQCHSTEPDWVPATFAIHNDYYPLNGAHAAIANDCAACHNGDYNNTPNTCIGCHQTDFEGATDPDHVAAQFATDCTTCHSESTWSPSSFDHDNFYPLNGAHSNIANECALCHINGNFSNTPNQCAGCHQTDFDNTVNPNHVAAQFPTDCIECHTESEWVPATFDHDSQYFPIYSGAHEGEWSQCIDCHSNPANYAEVSCVVCHTNPETNDAHVSVNGYVYENTACLACHPTGDATNIFDHQTTAFPLTGAHFTTECISCHSAGYQNTPAECAACHQVDFDGAANPNHVALGLPTDCAQCHTTEPEWLPAAFPDHDDYYALNGAHAAIANECATCHNGNYNNTPNTCYGCHQTDYNTATDPEHKAAQFPTNCTQCHTENEWTPANFDHNSFYPLTGEHAAIANECALCHINGNYNNTPNTCTGCHQDNFDQSTNPDHGTLAIPTDCAMCHTTEPDWEPANFPIHDDYYALNGAHAAIANECATCHNGNYNNTPNTCYGCHQGEYENTTNPNHQTAQFSNDCATCHTENEWIPATFDHDAQYFPIYSGAHEGEWNQCAECHTNPNNFADFTCVTCHANPETDDQHTGVNGYVYESNACLACHPTGDASNPFDHNNTNFPLTGEHLMVNCIECHANGYQGTPTDCVACHQTDYDGSVNPNHVSLNIPADCAMCHTTEPEWQPATFPIHDDYYQLNGAHANISNDCAACHNGNYNNTPNTCYGCHQSEYQNTTNPDHEVAQFSTDCTQCHTEVEWVPANFDHNSVYPLTGAHAAIANDCNLCHIGGNYNNTPNTCVGCHQADFDQSINPNHPALAIPNDCAMCHTTEPDWEPAAFPIHDNYYQLNGAHANISNDCAACHNGNYNNTPNTCYGCHQSEYENTTNPDHEAAQFPTDCTGCHSETAWTPANFDHSAFYPLTGAHAPIANDCNLCHANGNYNNTPNTCVGCHQADYDQSTNPNHLSLALPTDCESCHTTEPGWAPATFAIHDNYWVLDGAHLMVNDCAECHNGNYNNTPNTCVGCHQADYNQSANPDHAALGIPTDCAMCHTTDPGWDPATFPIHDSYWVLDGEHLSADCIDCHNGNYNNTPNTCVGCHQADYDQTINPDHDALAIPTDCAMCHTTDPDWMPATFPIHDNYYILMGAHAAIANDCAACHNGNYNNTPNTCFGCHEADYNATTNPAHLSAGFPTTCDDCHSENAWTPANFDHSIFYPLTGAHQAIENDCALCHIGGNYNNTPTTCEGCHTPAYNTSTNPNHSALAIPMDCAMCHTTDPDWMPATFPIHNNYYQLNGAHAAIQNDCAACHNGNYNNTPNTCFGCHQSEYNNTNNPDHASAGFPTACEDCHSETAWTPANFDHDNMYFPIYSGKHEGEWNLCVDCHIGGNFNSFSCIDCHEHDDPVQAADDHQGVSGYSYSSPACYSCHPTGED